MDGKAAAVSGVVGVGEVVAFAEGAVSLLKRKADSVGAAMEPGDDLRNVTALKELVSQKKRSIPKKSSRSGIRDGRTISRST